jgi:poly(A)-specific ribonuclease
MDIQKSQFPQEILSIIQHVADSHFIAFDLEFSGVAGRRKVPPGGKRDKLTLQELYEDVKEAAEKYQILQVGLTIVQEDQDKGKKLIPPRSNCILWAAAICHEFHFSSVHVEAY